MNSRERIRAIVAGETPDRPAFWLGNPHGDTWPIYLEHFGVEDGEALRRLLNDDYRWTHAECGGYKHPEGKPVFQFRRENGSGPTCMAECETAADVDLFEWPDPKYMDFAPVIEAHRNAGDCYRAGGMWSPFFHVVADAFGMQNYFMMMYTKPAVVDAVTDRVCSFYYEATERFFQEAGDEVDAFFFGNDFGTQLDLLISEDLFDRFIMPWFRKLTDLGHRHGRQVILHSCGAVHRVIGRLIDAGVDALHPLQARAQDMDAATLARDFGGRIAFIGGIDTQQLLVHGTPEDIRSEVRRVADLLGPNLVVSPSHEALLPNVPAENVRAMAEETAKLAAS